MPIFVLFSLAAISTLISCKSRSDLRRDQEMERLRQELSSVKGEKADAALAADELRQEILRLSNVVEENAQLAQRRHEEAIKRDEEIRKELTPLSGRLEMIETKELESSSPKNEPEKKPLRFETGKRLFDSGKYLEAIDVFKAVALQRSRADEARRAQFMVAECYFEIKDYASAALEYSEFKKSYPRDPQVPSAIYRQANAFRLMGRGKEAKLFYQELFDKFPKHILAAKGKEEIKKLR